MTRDESRRIQYEVKVYMLELYKDDLLDLLQRKEGKDAPQLSIKKDPRGTSSCRMCGRWS